MDIILDNIGSKYVRRIITASGETLYVVSVSVCKDMSSDGFATFVVDRAHIKFKGSKCTLAYEEDVERTFKIKNNEDYFTTAQLPISVVAESHMAAVEERRKEREEAELKELNEKLHDTKYYAVYSKFKDMEKLIHSYKTVDEVKEEIKKIAFNILDTDLNQNIMKRITIKCDMTIKSENGYLTIIKTSYKRDAFAKVKNTSEYVLGDSTETSYYVLNDKRMLISTWDWQDVVEDVILHQISNDDILYEERTEEEWARVQEIATNNLKNKNCTIANLTSVTREDSIEETEESEPQEEENI